MKLIVYLKCLHKPAQSILGQAFSILLWFYLKKHIQNYVLICFPSILLLVADHKNNLTLNDKTISQHFRKV